MFKKINIVSEHLINLRILVSIFISFLICYLFYINIFIGGFLICVAMVFIAYFICPHKLLILFGIFLLVQNLIVAFLRIGLIQYFDEAFIILFFVFTIFRKIIKKERFITSPIDKPLIFLIILGGISSLVQGSTSIFVATVGLLLLIKGLLLFYIFANIDYDEKKLRSFLRVFLFVALFISVTGILGFIDPNGIGKILNVNPEYERLGFIPAQSFLGHPGGFATIIAIFSCFVMAHYLVTSRAKSLFLSLFLLVCLLLSLRRTSVFGLLLAIFLAVFFIKKRTIKPRTKKVFLIVFIIFLLFSSLLLVNLLKLFLKEYSDFNETARGMLTIAGVRIALDKFPLGSGFGTFGGWMSRMFYSPLYFQYRLSSREGLSPTNPSFLLDTFWTHILAEVGIIGFIFYVLIIISLFKICLKGQVVKKGRTFEIFSTGVFMLFILGLIESTKAVAFENSLFCYFYFGSLGIIFSLVNSQDHSEIKKNK